MEIQCMLIKYATQNTISIHIGKRIKDTLRRQDVSLCI